jgi:hypothetical protein
MGSRIGEGHEQDGETLLARTWRDLKQRPAILPWRPHLPSV